MKIKKYILLIFFMLFVASVSAQVSEYEYKAAFIERFTRFVEWPTQNEDDNFTIVVFGKNLFNNSLDNLFEETRIKDKKVKIIYTTNLEDLKYADMVFISVSEKKRIEEILEYTSKYTILTIGDSKGLCAKGVHINMYVEGSYLKYEINQNEIEKSGLTVSSLLLASAKIVKTND